ncbi:MAG: alpha/beta fold hydrolase [Ardenticatenaceae bacterium]|nr:alpha/beta fold hydrolase [Ardenticatenaceae bacterium]
MMQIEQLTIPACDGYSLAATRYQPEDNPTNTVVLINSATAVPQRYYKYFAIFLAREGYTAVTYDYRGIAGSKPTSLRGFAADARDWALQDMAGVIEWVQKAERPRRLFMVGHSYGGQTAGLLPNHNKIAAMVTFSSQSGYWRLQGGNQKMSAAFHVHLTLPLLSHLFGYMPWSKISSAEDLPKGVALEWSRWCRHPGYLLDDQTLPLERFQQFRAPVLAYSIDDDDWGTARSVDAMMRAYPNLTRRHIVPQEWDLPSLGHFGYFRPKSKVLWPDVVEWLEQAAPLP